MSETTNNPQYESTPVGFSYAADARMRDEVSRAMGVPLTVSVAEHELREVLRRIEAAGITVSMTDCGMSYPLSSSGEFEFEDAGDNSFEPRNDDLP